MARVLLDNVSKHFPGSRKELVHAVRNVSLEIGDREFLVLVGPSGCGKSTLLRLIAGLEEISEGTISIDGRVVNSVEPKDRDIAMVFQNYALYPHMTVYENMAFGLKLRKVPKSEIDRRVREAAEILGLSGLFDRLPKALSGGQRQRVAVGRAIVRQPKVFLFDEPLSNLDAQMRVQMRQEISRLHKRLAATMVLVTHDQVEAMTLGDRVAVMRNGLLQQIAEPLKLYHEPANLFVAGFIGSPPMNFFRGKLVTKGSSVALKIGEASEALELPLPKSAAEISRRANARELILGLRPEDIRESSSDLDASTESVSRISAIVQLAEPMGCETFLHATTAGQPFVARVHAGHRAALGSKMTFDFNLEKAHLFDPVTECALR